MSTMPRLILLRSVVFVACTWLTLTGLWMGLPSPTYSYTDVLNKYELTEFTLGETISRVYKVNEYFPSYHTVQAALDVANGRHFFALDVTIQCDPSKNSLFLTIGGSTTFDLTRDISNPASKVSIPKLAPVKTGDMDGTFPEWFDDADAVLFFWESYRETVQYPFRLRSSKAGYFELWQDLVFWNEQQEDADSRVPDNLHPLMVIDFQQSSETCGIRNASILFPKETHNQSPSRTYNFRRAIGRIVVPTGWAIIKSAMVIGFFLHIFLVLFNFTAYVGATYLVIVLCVWNAERRPPMAEWSRQSRLTRRFLRVYDRYQAHRSRSVDFSDVESKEGKADQTSSSVDTPSHDDTYGYKPLSSFSSFLTSKSPLNDLFATFECTRWLLKPIEEVLGLPYQEMQQYEDDDDLENQSSSRNPFGPRPLTGVVSFFTSHAPLESLLITFESTKRFARRLSTTVNPLLSTSRDEDDQQPVIEEKVQLRNTDDDFEPANLTSIVVFPTNLPSKDQKPEGESSNKT